MCSYITGFPYMKAFLAWWTKKKITENKRVGFPLSVAFGNRKTDTKISVPVGQNRQKTDRKNNFRFSVRNSGCAAAAAAVAAAAAAADTAAPYVRPLHCFLLDVYISSSYFHAESLLFFHWKGHSADFLPRDVGTAYLLVPWSFLPIVCVRYLVVHLTLLTLRPRLIMYSLLFIL